MSFSSLIYPNEPVIDESKSAPFGFTGYLGREYGYGKGFMKTGVIPRIPRSEWDDRIRELEDKRARLSDLLFSEGWTVHNQQDTNYCWVFAATAAVEFVRLLQAADNKRLSPASVGSKITNFRNVGGWSTRAIEFISVNGIVPADLWPPTAISRKYDKVEYWEEAKKYQIIEWADLEPKTLDELFSALLIGFPVAVGYDWWGHAVVALDAVKIDGKYGVRIANSWGDHWGSRGLGILLGQRAIPDDACAPMIIVPK